MQGISAAGTLARYFSLRFLIAMLAMFAVCCVLIFFVDFIEMLRRAGNYNGESFRLPARLDDVASLALLLRAHPPLRRADRHGRHFPDAEPLLRADRRARRRRIGMAVHAPRHDRRLPARRRFRRHLQSAGRGRARRSRAALRPGLRPRRDICSRPRMPALGCARTAPTVRPSSMRCGRQIRASSSPALPYSSTTPDQTPTERIEARKAILKDGRWELRTPGSVPWAASPLCTSIIFSAPTSPRRRCETPSARSSRFRSGTSRTSSRSRSGRDCPQRNTACSINCYCRGLSCS